MIDSTARERAADLRKDVTLLVERVEKLEKGLEEVKKESGLQ